MYVVYYILDSTVLEVILKGAETVCANLRSFCKASVVSSTFRGVLRSRVRESEGVAASSK